MIWSGIVLVGVAMQVAVAQQGMGTQQMSIGQNQSLISSFTEPVAGAPYQAEKVARSVQTLSDGTVITNETRGTIARDAQGRVREDIYQIHSGNIDGKQMEMTFQSATVGDPVTHALLIWTGTDTKIAMRMQMPSLQMPKGTVAGMLTAPPPPPPPGSNREIKMIKEDAPPPIGLATPPPVIAGQMGNGRITTNAMPNLGMPNSPLISSGLLGTKHDVQTEELGQQSIEGVVVTGKRTTTTIPMGEVGNDRPIKVVHEEWRSPELKILVKTIDTDPRTGEQTMELQGLTRIDPDAALFQAPAGYKVQDMADMLKGLGNLGHTPPQ
jgi:hypothetical protein